MEKLDKSNILLEYLYIIFLEARGWVLWGICVSILYYRPEQSGMIILNDDFENINLDNYKWWATWMNLKKI